MIRVFLLVTAILVSTSGVGCSGKTMLEGAAKTIVVVSLDGQPVEGAAVVFSPLQEGRSASGLTDAQGRAEMGTAMPADGVLPGKYAITVVKSIDDPNAPVDLSNEAPTGRAYSAPQIYLVPKKYIDPKNSGLTATIQLGQVNNVPLDLNSK